jgi:spore maturation protein CgeB
VSEDHAMRIVMFYHSILSDWNHGNAHFLRGVATELARRGHAVRVYEPEDAWSRVHLEKDHGSRPFARFHARYGGFDCLRYASASLDLDEALDGADLVLVHEWNDPELVRAIGRHRARAGSRYRLFFHDTHHRAVTAPDQMKRYRLEPYDGVLAFGRVLRDLYLERGWCRRAWVWHEAADVRVFRPHRAARAEGDLVWIGNWGDEQRTAELREFLFEPVRRLGLRADAYGVRYPEAGLRALADAGMAYRGWLPNFDVPPVFARYRVTVHIPRRPYSRALPGIPTIRPFEALACGIPLVCSPWKDVEGLFTPGKDYLEVSNGDEMRSCLQVLLRDEDLRRELAEHGLRTVRARHTCAHRVDELLDLYATLTERKRAGKTIQR